MAACVDFCVSVLGLWPHHDMAPHCVSLLWHCQKSILACHSSEDQFISVMSTFAWRSVWRYKSLMMEFEYQCAQW